MKKKILNLQIEKVPFVPAFDLLEMEENRLSESEAAAVGLAIHLSLSKSVKKSNWQKNSSAESLECRL